jgi:hypothetical protein
MSRIFVYRLTFKSYHKYNTHYFKTEKELFESTYYKLASARLSEDNIYYEHRKVEALLFDNGSFHILQLEDFTRE